MQRQGWRKFYCLIFMNAYLAFLVPVMCLASCSSYHPMKDKDIYPRPLTASKGCGVKVSYFGNTNVLISDGTTNLLVDGFFTRPGKGKTLLGLIEPDRMAIAHELKRAGISKLDAVLVGHAHWDHAMDSPVVAEMTDALVMGTESYRFIHEGAGGKMDPCHLFTVPCDGMKKCFGKFTVTYRRSEHVGSHNLPQRAIEGDIKKPVKMPARFSDLKCGDVFVMHIAHPDGNIVVTTTGGACKGQLDKLCADVVFLSIGFLDKEPPEKQCKYWRETVGTVMPKDDMCKTVIPVHWDDFSYPLSRGLIVAPPGLTFSTEAGMKFVKERAREQGVRVRAIDIGDSFLLQNHEMKTVLP